MTDLPLIHVGDLNTEIQVLVQFADLTDVVQNVAMNTSTSKKISFKDPDYDLTQTLIGPFDCSFVTNGTDSLVKYITDGTTSIWNKAGVWRWFITYTVPSGTYSTEDAVREIIK